MFLEFILIVFLFLILYAIVVQKSQGLLFVVSTTILLFVVPPDVLIGGKYTPTTIVLFFSLFFLFFYKSNYNSLKTFPLLRFCVFYMLGLLVIGISDLDTKFDVNLNTTILYILNNAFPFLLFYAIFNKNRNFNDYFNSLVVIFYVICLYGIFNYVSESNPLSTAFSDTFKIRNIAADYLIGLSINRQQISSVFFHPYMYSILLFYLLLYLSSQMQSKKSDLKRGRKILNIGLIFLCIINVYLVGSRTSYMIILFGLFLMFFSSYKSLLRLILILPIFSVMALQIPQVNDAVDSTLDIFASSTQRKTEGSSVEMRQLQLAISLKYFNDHPYLGNGIYSIIKKIGYATDINKRTSDADAFGFESFLFVLLIEQGLLGIIIHVLLFYYLIRYHFKNMVKAEGVVKDFIRFNLIFILGYLVYILGTGTINTLPIFFSFMGISLAYQKTYCLSKLSKN